MCIRMQTAASHFIALCRAPLATAVSPSQWLASPGYRGDTHHGKFWLIAMSAAMEMARPAGRDTCINGNEDSSWQGDLCFYSYDGIEWDVHRRPVWKQRHPHRGVEGHIALERDREPFGYFDGVFEGNHQLFGQEDLAFEGIVCVIGNISGGAPAHVASSCASTWSITAVAWARVRRSSTSIRYCMVARRQSEKNGSGEGQACAAAQAGRRRREVGCMRE